jgi:hypothetical protein
MEEPTAMFKGTRRPVEIGSQDHCVVDARAQQHGARYQRYGHDNEAEHLKAVAQYIRKTGLLTLRHVALKKIPVAEDAWSAGPAERITVRTPSASATPKIRRESDQEHDQEENDL